ncbi:TBC1 domain family member 30 isoform X2 [Tetranychus urticae]|uniref:TBC1 domain family member 30 isoform X2 n=1 Tax=Tetranychus urticae TaxID=32264 RepID=UPI00077BB06B|nr:TBC1 domain family member 30 isoform X2 [Tetranychus urticae]
MSQMINSAILNLGRKLSSSGVDTKMRFSIEPIPGDSGFNQWHDAMRMVARLPGGIPNEFRKKLWLTLSERFIESRNINWSKTSKFCFNEKCNPEDDSLGTQIVKDLHRTGCSLFSGEDSEHNQALLKQVLLAFARWNRGVGYCQGFNMLAAIILEVMNWDVDNSLKVMIYLIEGVLPTSYFANNLRGLSVDMAAFRDLLRLRLPQLSKHLDKLQNEAQDLSTGASYEPPLVNVFTMQWFLTLFSNCLPKPLVLRIWDLIFLEGNEILIRTALAIWDCLQDRIINVESADEFYSIMGVLTREMMEFGVRDTNELVKTICTMAPFPFPQLADFREKYTFNIRPLTSLVKKGVNLFYSDEEEDDSTTDPIMVASWCLSNAFSGDRSRERSGSRATSPSTLDGFSNSLSMIGTTIGTNSTNFLSSANIDPQRMSLDISLLKKQYMKLKERQRQAHIILIEGFQNAQTNSVSRKQSMTVNHLLQGKTALIAKRPRKPCSVRQPTIGSVASANGSGRCPGNKKFLTERSKTVANLDPMLKPEKKLTVDSKATESGETLFWTDLRSERQKNRIARKMSEPSLSICHESSIEANNSLDEPEVAFIGYSTSSSGLTISKPIKRFDGPKKESSVDSDDDDDYHVSTSSSSSKSSNSILSSECHDDSSSTELCDDIDEDEEDNNNNNINKNIKINMNIIKSSDELNTDDGNNNLAGLVTHSGLSNPSGQTNVEWTGKLKSKKQANEIEFGVDNDLESDSISAKNCLNNKKIWRKGEPVEDKVINLSTEVYPLETADEPEIVSKPNSQFIKPTNGTELIAVNHIDEIKKELSDLSVEQCIQKLNEKISSLSST